MATNKRSKKEIKNIAKTMLSMDTQEQVNMYIDSLLKLTLEDEQEIMTRKGSDSINMLDVIQKMAEKYETLKQQLSKEC